MILKSSKSKKQYEIELLPGKGIAVDAESFGKLDKDVPTLLKTYFNSHPEKGLGRYDNEKVKEIEGWKNITVLENDRIIQCIKVSVVQLDALGHKNWLNPAFLDENGIEAKRTVLLISTLLREKLTFNEKDFLFILNYWVKKAWFAYLTRAF